MEPFSWAALRRILRRGEIAIEDIARFLGFTSTVSLEPEPIPLKVKVILFGDRLLYFLLAAIDPELADYFKVKADFENDFVRTPENEAILARLLATLTQRDGLNALDRDAVALVLEHAARLADHAGKLSLIVEQLREILIEADFCAGQAERAVISRAVLIGVPKEIKTDEYRVGLVPATIKPLTAKGHNVIVETRAGEGAGISDEEYVAAGAEIITNADQIFARCELIVKVKEPLDLERKWLRRGQIIFTYLHLAADPEQTRDLMASGVIAIAYETVTDAEGKLPLLAPMSKIAGRMAPQVAAHFLERPQGGRGILLGGINGVPAGQVVILGGGVVGCNAAEIALGMGADVAILVRSASTADQLSQRFGSRALVFATAGISSNALRLC